MEICSTILALTLIPVIIVGIGLKIRSFSADIPDREINEEE